MEPNRHNCPVVTSPPNLTPMSTGLYIHIPFCASRCPYCDFAFVVRKTHLADRYAEAVIREFRTRLPHVGPRPVFKTVYFGGGTPSAVPPALLQRVLNAVRSEAEIDPGAEITAEANPGDRAAFQELRETGINRLSLGVQALDDRTLKALGRFHNTADALEAFQTARQAGFGNINIDLIFGAPEQSVPAFTDTLDRAAALCPDHLSVYGLTVEPETAFGRRFRKGRLPLPCEGNQAAMYSAALDLLAEAGYRHYEISNFARPGFASRHNLDCWEGRPYLGIGMSAHSFLNNRRSWNIRDLMAYIKKVELAGTATGGGEEIDKEDRFLEQIMLGLRQRKGIPETLLANHRTAPSLDRLLSQRLLQRSGKRLCLTRRGLLLADLVCAELVKES